MNSAAPVMMSVQMALLLTEPDAVLAPLLPAALADMLASFVCDWLLTLIS
jgi:hypothetical protein